MTAYPICDPQPIVGSETPIGLPARGHLLAVPDLTGYAELRIWAESYADAQDHRIRLFNRLGLKADGTPTKAGTAVDLDSFGHIVDPVLASEKHIKRMLRNTYRRVAPPGVIAWQESTFGIGEHLLARLLGALGHPRIATPYHWEGEGSARTLVADEVFERTVRQLWTYCGHGAALRRRKGMTAEEAFALGSPLCKMLTHLLAEASIKCRVEPNLRATANGGSADPTLSPDQPIPEANASWHSAARDLSSHPSIADASAMRAAAGGDHVADRSICDSISDEDSADRHLSPYPSTLDANASCSPAGKGSFADQSIYKPTASVSAADRRYRLLYEQRRAHTATTHPEWTAGHSHNDALRIVGKQLLADLWEAAA